MARKVQVILSDDLDENLSADETVSFSLDGTSYEIDLAEKWDLYIGGIERATAYSELVDPIAQRERFTAQAALAAAGDPEAMALDEDFLEALEYGMPPTGGMGMGMDRLMMTLTGLGIRETILFPLVRPITSQ